MPERLQDGRPKGKGKSKLDEHREDILKLLSLKVPKTMIARQFNTSVGNLNNFLNRIKVVNDCSKARSILYKS